MGGRPSKNIHCHIHIHEEPTNCSCVCRSPSGTTSASPFQPPDYKRNADDFESLEQVTQALAQAGLESSNLIVGIDYTKSNTWTGKRSFMGRNLHDLDKDCPNPYAQAISIIGRTLLEFDDDNQIPCYGFGDATTGDQEVFSFHLGDTPCHGFEEVLSRYGEITPHVKLAGPTSFGPIIRNAIRIVNNSGGQYHVLLIIADGQVTRSIDTCQGDLSPQEQSTVDAIVEASKYPLSIVVVGVGDGPWDQMYKCDDQIPARAFDNVQFVNFTEIMEKNIPMSKKETEFALKSLMEIPSQYKATMSLQLLGQRKETPWQISFPRPPPIPNIWRTNSSRDKPVSRSGPSSPSYSILPRSFSSSSSSFNKMCPECYLKEKDCAFGCGHQTCWNCGQNLSSCPTCQTQITTRIKLLD